MSRAKIGMSTRAAITAAPTKKLTTSAPHAGVLVTARGGTRGLPTDRLRSQKSAAATALSTSSHGPAGENTCTFGSAVAKARITPASATASRRAPSTSTFARMPRQDRRSSNGRRCRQAPEHQQQRQREAGQRQR